MDDIYEHVGELTDEESIDTDSEEEEIEELPCSGLNMSKEEAERWFNIDLEVSFNLSTGTTACLAPSMNRIHQH